MKIRIFIKFFFWFIILSIIPLFTIAIVSYNLSKKELTKDIYNNLITIRDYKQLMIQDFILNKISCLEELSKRPSLINNIDELIKTYKKGEKSSDFIQMQDFFKSEFSPKIQYDNFNDLFIIATSEFKGDILFSMKNEPEYETNLLTGPYKNTELSKAFVKSTTLMAPIVTNYQEFLSSKKWEYLL